jgi:hypothetical protein
MKKNTNNDLQNIHIQLQIEQHDVHLYPTWCYKNCPRHRFVPYKHILWGSTTLICIDVNSICHQTRKISIHECTCNIMFYHYIVMRLHCKLYACRVISHMLRPVLPPTRTIDFVVDITRCRSKVISAHQTIFMYGKHTPQHVILLTLNELTMNISDQLQQCHIYRKTFKSLHERQDLIQSWTIYMQYLCTVEAYRWYVYEAYKQGNASPFPRFEPNTHIYLYASTVHMYCIYPAILNRK